MSVPVPAPSRPSQPDGIDEVNDVVVVDQLVKRYAKLPFNAVDGVSFSVRRGEVFGLLGPNGAGKTTTIGVLTTRVRPTAGRALVVGIDVSADPVGAKRALAVVPQLNNLDRSLSAKRNLLFHAAYFGIPEAERLARADRLLEELGLADRADDKVDRFSGGQAQRLMIARALMHDPQVLFMDETIPPLLTSANGQQGHTQGTRSGYLAARSATAASAHAASTARRVRSSWFGISWP